MDTSLLLNIGAKVDDLEKGIASASKTLGKFGKELATLGKNLTQALTVPLAGLGAAALAASEGMDDAMNRIRAGTGAVGDTFHSLGQTMRQVFASVPNSLGQVSDAVTDLYQRTKLTGPALQDMATTMLDLARITGGEVKPLIDSTQKAFQGWQVATSDQEAALDTLLKVSQATGISFQELSDTMGAGGTALRGIGMNFTDAAATIGLFSKMGLSAEEAITAITKESTKAAKSGQDMSRAFAALLDQMKRAPTMEAAMAIGADVFGKKTEAMAAAIRRGAFDVADLVKQIQASDETIHKAAADTETLTQAFTKLGHDAMEAMEPLGKAITQLLLDLVPAFQSLIGIVSDVVAAFVALPTGVQDTVIVFGAMAAAAGPLLLAFGALTSGWASVVSSALRLKAVVGPALVAISEVAGNLALSISSLSPIFGALGRMAVSVGAEIAGFGAGLVELATGPIGLVVAGLALLASKWEPLGRVISEAIDLIGAACKKAFEVIKATVLDFASGMEKDIAEAFDKISKQSSSFFKSITADRDTFWGDFWDGIVSDFDKAYKYVSDMCDKMKAYVQAFIDWVTKGLNALADTMHRARVALGGDEESQGGAAGTEGRQTAGGAAPAKPPSSGGAPIIDYGGGGSPAAGAKGAGGSSGSGGSSGGGSGGSGGGSGGRLPGWEGGPGGIPGNAAGIYQINSQTSVQLRQGEIRPGVFAGIDDNNSYSGTTGFSPDGNYTGYAPKPAAGTGPKDVGPGNTTIAPATNNKGLITVTPDNSRSYGGDANPTPSGRSGDVQKGSYGSDGTFYTGGALPGDGVAGVDPNIPAFASGGIVDRKTLAYIGEAGPEAVIPLDKLKGMSGTTIHVHVYGTVAAMKDLAKQVRAEFKGMSRRNGDDLGVS